MGSKICKPKMMDCLTCPKNNPKESFCFDKEECSVPFAMVRDGKIIAWEENKEDKKMRCADCGFYECALRTPLGGCPNGEKSEHSQIITTPDTRPYDLGHGPFEKGYQPADAMKALDEKIKKVSERGTWDGVDVDKYMAELRGYYSVDPTVLKLKAKALVDAVDRYTMGKCLRSELLIKNNELKKLL